MQVAHFVQVAHFLQVAHLLHTGHLIDLATAILLAFTPSATLAACVVHVKASSAKAALHSSYFHGCNISTIYNKEALN